MFLCLQSPGIPSFPGNQSRFTGHLSKGWDTWRRGLGSHEMGLKREWNTCEPVPEFQKLGCMEMPGYRWIQEHLQNHRATSGNVCLWICNSFCDNQVVPTAHCLCLALNSFPLPYDLCSFRCQVLVSLLTRFQRMFTDTFVVLGRSLI